MTDYVVVLSTRENCGGCLQFKLTGSQDRFVKAVMRFGDRVKLINDDYTGSKANWKVSHPNLDIEGVPDITIIRTAEFNNKESNLPSRKSVPLHQIAGKSVDENYDVLKKIMGIEKEKIRFRRRKEIKKGETTDLGTETFSLLNGIKESKPYGFPKGAVDVRVKKPSQHLQKI